MKKILITIIFSIFISLFLLNYANSLCAAPYLRIECTLNQSFYENTINRSQYFLGSVGVEMNSVYNRTNLYESKNLWDIKSDGYGIILIGLFDIQKLNEENRSLIKNVCQEDILPLLDYIKSDVTVLKYSDEIVENFKVDKGNFFNCVSYLKYDRFSDWLIFYRENNFCIYDVIDNGPLLFLIEIPIFVFYFITIYHLEINQTIHIALAYVINALYLYFITCIGFWIWRKLYKGKKKIYFFKPDKKKVILFLLLLVIATIFIVLFYTDTTFHSIILNYIFGRYDYC